MPEETILSEHEADEAVTLSEDESDFEAAFADDDNGNAEEQGNALDPGAEEEPPLDSDPGEQQEEGGTPEASDAPTDKDKGSEEEEPPADDSDAMAALEKYAQTRAASDGGGQEKSTGGDAGATKADNGEQQRQQSADQPKGQGQQPQKLTKEQIKGILDFAGDDLIPDTSFTIGDEEIDLSVLKDTPEISTAIKIGSVLAAQKFVNNLVARGELMTAKQVQGEMQSMRKELSSLRFWNEVSDKGHPDAKIINGTPEFQAWLDKQSGTVKKLASSATPEDAAFVFGAYKSEQAKAKVGEHDEAARKKKARHDALHKSTLRGRQATQQKGGKAEDFEAAFNEDD